MRWITIWLLMCGVAVGQVDYYTGTNTLIDTGLSSSNDVITVCGWAKLTTGDMVGGAQYDNIILYSVEGHRPSLSSYGIALSNRRVSQSDFGAWWFEIFSESSRYTAKNSTPTEVNRLYFIAGVYDKTNVSLYIDGLLVDQVPFSGVPNNKPIYVGSIPNYSAYRGTSWSFNGILTDVRYYTRALSAEEIAIISTPETAYMLADDPDLVLRECVTTNDTGDALTGVAKNYGTGADGTYSNSPTAAPWTIQMQKPRRATINID